MRRMLIALDYDDTYTRDPELWINFVRSAQMSGHEVICVTMKHELEGLDMDGQLTSRVRVIYTGRKAKIPYLKALWITPDIWIDERPCCVLNDPDVQPEMQHITTCLYGSRRQDK